MTLDFNKLFDMPVDKFFVGYEPMLKKFQEAHDTLAKSIPNYPPYNIVKLDDNKYVIELAVAGFGKHNLDITTANGTLTITGNSQLNSESEEGQKNNYLYKGIADRAFTRTFSVADTVEVKNAELLNGMLKIWLENIIPDSKKPKKVDINDSASTEKVTSKQLLTEDKDK